MKNLVSSILALLCFTLTVAQNPLVKQWDKRFGGYDCDELFAFQQTTDAGYILGGWSQSDSSSDKTENSHGGFDFWIVKTDALGNKQWDKTFAVGNYNYNKLYALKQTTDGGYLLGGYSGSSTNHDFWIVKITSSGIMEWNKAYGGTGNDELNSLQQTVDGGYILGGYSSSGISGDKTTALRGLLDYWIVKIDSSGTKQWDKGYGGNQDDLLYSIAQTTDGGYVLGGYSYSGINGDKGQANWDTSFLTADYWLVKVDTSGNLQWERRFGGNNTDYLRSLQQTYDGGYILGGLSGSPISGDKSQANWNNSLDYWIVKTDSWGNIEWNKRFGGYGNEDEFGNISQTPDSGYLLAGTSYSIKTGEKSEYNLGQEQAWIVKTDLSGYKQWDKTILTTGHDESAYAIQTSDGCYAIAITTPSGIGGYKTEANANPAQFGSPLANLFLFRDYWLVKFCDTTGCSSLAATITTNSPAICAYDTTQICAPSGFANYLWNNGANTNCIYTNIAGNYDVTVTASYGCSAESNHIIVTVLPLPPISVSVNNNELTVYNAISQQWYLNDTAVSGATSSTYVVTQGGSYTVVIVDSNGCEATSNAIIVTGIETLIGDNMLSVYPNPLSTGDWQLTVSHNLIGGIVELFDADGKLVFYSSITNLQSQITADVARGVYLLRVSSVKSSVTKKLVRL